MIQADADFQNFKQTLKQEALSLGISSTLFNTTISKIKIDPDVIKLDSSQPEFTRNIWDYLDKATSNSRLQKGKSLLQKHSRILAQVEKRYGVQKEIIVAIWAMESDFGRNFGNKNILRSLATLAHSSQSKKRSDFARKELLLALRVLQSQKIKAKDLIGSWAGAMGQPQFMPSSYLQYAVDYNQDGSIDLWQSIPDVFASIANFLSESGWRDSESWGVEVKLPIPFDWRLNNSSYQLRFKQWQKSGLNPVNSIKFEYPERQASLFIPAGKSGPKFLVNHNFEVIKEYNKSISYTLAVAQLSRLLSGGDNISKSWPRTDIALSRYQVEEIQKHLIVEGHNPGVVDGKIGSKTREAIRTWQIEQGYAGDGYANQELLKLLRIKK